MNHLNYTKAMCVLVFICDPDRYVLDFKRLRTGDNDTTARNFDMFSDHPVVINVFVKVKGDFGYGGIRRRGLVTETNDTISDMANSSGGCGTSHVVISHGIQAVINYEYVGLRQLTKVTLPDSVTSFTYNAIHHLTNIGDSLHNSLNFALDAADKRIKINVTEIGGILARQTSRVHDVSGRRTQVTGATQ